LYIGWGAYTSMGHEHPGEKIRIGVFDWITGELDSYASYERKWMRDMVGMSLRGVSFTAPLGLIFLYFGYG